MRALYLITAYLLLTVVQSMKWDGPNATLAVLAIGDALGFSPRPTNAPGRRLGRIELLKRQETDSNVCGYESGVLVGEITCSSDRTCFYSTNAIGQGMRGCCASTNSLDCGWATGCVDAKAFKSSCDKVCKGNPFLLKCTNSGESFCVSYTYPDVNVKDFACKSVVESAIRSVSLTYKGQKLPTSLSSSLRTISLDVEASRSIFQNDNADITEASATTRTAKPSGSAAPGARREKSNVGAIAGGAVGGVAVFAAAAGGAAFLILRSRRKRKGTPASGMDPSEGTAIPQEMDGHENEKAMIYEADSATTKTNPGVFEADSTPIVAANEPMEAGNGGPVNSHFAPTQFLHPAAPTYQPSHAMSATSGPVASGYSEPATTGHAQHSGENPVGRVGSSSTATLTPNSPVSRAVSPSSFVSPVSPPPPASPLPP